MINVKVFLVYCILFLSIFSFGQNSIDTLNNLEVKVIGEITKTWISKSGVFYKKIKANHQTLNKLDTLKLNSDTLSFFSCKIWISNNGSEIEFPIDSNILTTKLKESMKAGKSYFIYDLVAISKSRKRYFSKMYLMIENTK